MAQQISDRFWQAEEDRAVSGMSRYMADKIPYCEAIYIPNSGHFWVFEHMGEMLDKLVPSGGSSRLK